MKIKSSYEFRQCSDLTSEMSILKVDVLIDIINDFLGNNYAWINSDFKITRKYNTTDAKHLIRLNELVDANYIK
uniref:Uncharacterized protein n=1 Tax=Pithovirus LCPAC404 TaxID=2506597 RepID=A0A481ZC36_9VIRU|nr:MAG: hypothetical protein LCPAC404_01420 [Pithovirus LCPAC404]